MRAIALALLAACGGKMSPAPSTSPELTPGLQPVAYLLGDWKAAHGTRSFVAAGGAIYGIALHDGTFDLDIIDDDEDADGPPDGALHWFAMPGGRAWNVLPVAKLDPGTSIPHRPAPELEAADLAFAADTAERGADGWTDAFAPDGWMWRKTGAVEKPAIHDKIAPLLASGTLAWAPIASGVEGDLGYTVGKATFTGKDSWKSTYITVWKRQPDGTWKVLCDTGRGVNEP